MQGSSRTPVPDTGARSFKERGKHASPRHGRNLVDSPHGDAAKAARAAKGAGGRRASFQRSQSFRINAITAGVATGAADGPLGDVLKHSSTADWLSMTTDEGQPYFVHKSSGVVSFDKPDCLKSRLERRASRAKMQSSLEVGGGTRLQRRRRSLAQEEQQQLLLQPVERANRALVIP